VDMISDDSAIFWKAFIHYDGQYRVIPMYITLSMDVASADNWWKTLVNVYKQKRRWAWGVENFPIVMRAFFKSRTIPLSMRLKHGFKLFETNISWATLPIILGIISWLPVLFAGNEFSHTIFYYSAGRVKHTIFSLATVGLGICIIVSLALLPKIKTRQKLLLKIKHAFEWLLIPIVSILLSALPALDAQTRLMFGKYLTFWVTPKQRNSK
jgi:hypothetical protein